MFRNYQNLADNYRPNNLQCAFQRDRKTSKLAPLEASQPYEEYNIKGELIGYYWRLGETVNLEFNIDGEITVASDTIVYRTSGKAPDEYTAGTIGTRILNVIDFRSWTCVGVTDHDLYDTYEWVEDNEFTYDVQGKTTYIPADNYLKDKHVEVALYNFRMEPIVKKTYAGKSTIIFDIDSELAKKLPRGIYYCSVDVIDRESTINIFDPNDCQLSIK